MHTSDAYTPTQANRCNPQPEPVMPNNAAVITRILDRHRIKQVDLADLTGLSESSISRMVNGSATVSPEVLRALWQRTNDHELLAIALGERDAVVLSITNDTDRSPTYYGHRVMASAAELLTSIVKPALGINRSSLVRLSDQLIRDAHLYRNRLVDDSPANQSTPSTPQASPGHHLDTVA